jgi:hypothetical protein
MAWECAECIRNGMTAVCHHCGKPLCEEHEVVLTDDALAEYDPAPAELKRTLPDDAVHCEDCQKQYHPKSQVVRSRLERIWT